MNTFSFACLMKMGPRWVSCLVLLQLISTVAWAQPVHRFLQDRPQKELVLKSINLKSMNPQQKKNFFDAVSSKSVSSLQGTESSGGGSVVLKGDQWILSDFSSISPAVQDSRPEQNETAQIRFSKSADSLFSTLDGWKNLKYDLVGTLASVALSSSVQWTLAEFESEANLAAYYLSNRKIKKYEVVVFEPVITRLGATSLEGLLLHESLRHVQLGLVGNHFGDQNLEKMTAMMILCEPTSKLSFYLQSLLYNQNQWADDTYGSFDELMSSSCNRRDLK